MKRLTVLLCFLLPLASTLNNRDWEAFKEKFERKYRNPNEEAYRKRIFFENKAFIDQHNSKHAQGESTFTLAINQFADITNEEFQESMPTYEMSPNEPAIKPYTSRGLGYDVVTVDWRDVGCVPLVKDQGDCSGAGYAFSAITCLEFVTCRVNKNMTLLSEQNVLDCSSTTDHGNNGCYNGTINRAFEYIIDNPGGVDKAKSYPYTGTDSDSCNYAIDGRGGHCTEIQLIPSGDEETLADASSYMGPIAATIDASQQSFQFYSSGMYIEPNCSSYELNHAVTIIGFGFENAGNYWTVRNSWGTTWGDNGYIQMAKDQDNQCGIATLASLCLY